MNGIIPGSQMTSVNAGGRKSVPRKSFTPPTLQSSETTKSPSKEVGERKSVQRKNVILPTLPSSVTTTSPSKKVGVRKSVPRKSFTPPTLPSSETTKSPSEETGVRTSVVGKSVNVPNLTPEQEAWFENQKKDGLKKSLISDDYLIIYACENSLENVTSYELNFLLNMVNGKPNPPIEKGIKESIMQNIFGENFYATHIGSVKQEVVALSAKDRESELERINNVVQDKINPKGSHKEILNLCEILKMFNDVYKNEIMDGAGLENLRNHRAVDVCFPHHSGAGGFFCGHFNAIGLASYSKNWDYLDYLLHDNRVGEGKFLRSMIRHELTHYTQDLLRFFPDRTILSDQAQALVGDRSGFNAKYIASKKDQSDYYSHAKERGAHITQILSGFEEVCGVPYGTFYFQKEGTETDRKEQAKKIVGKLNEYCKTKTGLSLNKFLSQGSEENKFLHIVQLLPEYLIKEKGAKETLQYLTEEINLSEEDLKNVSEKDLETTGNRTKIDECFEHLLEYIIPREDMIKIAEKIPDEETFIELEAKINTTAELDEQIKVYESQIVLMETLKEKMNKQSDSILMPRINDLIKGLKNDSDVKTYEQLKSQLEQAKAFGRNTTELSKQIDELSTNPKVESYIFLNALKEINNSLDNYPKTNLNALDELMADPDFSSSDNSFINNKRYELGQYVDFKNMTREDQKEMIDNFSYINENSGVKRLFDTLKEHESRKSILKSVRNIGKNVQNRSVLKEFNKNDHTLEKYVNDEELCRRMYSIIRKQRNNMDRAISMLEPLFEKDLDPSYSQIKDTLDRYKKCVSENPENKSALFAEVSERITNLYNHKKNSTNSYVSSNYDRDLQVKLQEDEDYIKSFDGILQNAINTHITNLKTEIKNKIKDARTNLINSKLKKYKAGKNSLLSIKNEIPNVVVKYYEYESTRNEYCKNGSGSDKINTSEGKLRTSFANVMNAFINLPQGVKTKLNLYFNWANRGLARLNPAEAKRLTQ